MFISVKLGSSVTVKSKLCHVKVSSQTNTLNDKTIY